MSISRIVLTAALGLAVAAPVAVFGQTTTPAPSAQASPGPRHRGMYGAALRGITLSDQQKQQIKTLMTQYRQAHPQGGQPDPQARQQLMQAVYNVLTPDQQAQYKANVAQVQSQSGGFSMGDGAMMSRNPMFAGITLSAQQQQQIQAIIAQSRQAHPEGSQADPQARQQLRQSILNVLTPAQQAQYNANRQRMEEQRKANGSNAPFPEASPSPIP